MEGHTSKNIWPPKIGLGQFIKIKSEQILVDEDKEVDLGRVGGGVEGECNQNALHACMKFPKN